eukprot:m.282508 g.282508  ORF g.282508 m.282508 type:complete len:523 (+) comp11112_c0_seq3:626-2194(+)
MSAPLRIPREDRLRVEQVLVQPALANLQGSDTIRFALPEGPGALDMSSLIVHLELELKDSAGAAFPHDALATSRVFAQEMFTSWIFSGIEGRINGMSISDDDGQMRGFPEAYRKMLSRPRGWFASAIRPASVPDSPAVRGNAATGGVIALNPEIAAEEGFALGEFLDSCATGFSDAANPAVIGIGGPADTRLDARKMARSRYLAPNTLAVAWKPDCAITRIDGLLPAGGTSIELLFEKGRPEHLVQIYEAFDNGEPGKGVGAPRITWHKMYLTLDRIIPKSAASPALYRPIVARTTRHIYNSVVLPRSIGSNASFNLPQLITGPRPDAVIFSVTPDAPVVGNTFRTQDDTAANPADYRGNNISLLGSGRGAAITANDAAADFTAPYATFTSFRARWGSEPLPAFGSITQTDAVQGALQIYYQMHRQMAAKLGGGGLSLGEFTSHFHVALDMSKEISEGEEEDNGSLSLEFSLAQSGVKAGQVPQEATLRLHVVALYHGGRASVMIGEGSANQTGRREVVRGW